MTEHTDHKTRDDGMIDYANYMARGRVMRSAAFLDALRKLRPRFGAGGRLRAPGHALRKLASTKPAKGPGAYHPAE